MKKSTFDKKMIGFMKQVLIGSTLIIMVVSTSLTTVSLVKKSTQMAMKEVEVTKRNTEKSFNQYHEVIWAIALDKRMQLYLKKDNMSGQDIDNANSVLDNASRMQGNINFISVIREDGRGQLIKGKSIPNWLVNYKENIKNGSEDGVRMSGNKMELHFTDDYYKNGSHTLSIYYPLYSNSQLGDKLGMLCINIDEYNLQQLYKENVAKKEFAMETSFVHSTGKIIASSKEEGMEEQLEAVSLQSRDGVEYRWGSINIYQKLVGWNFYYITSIAWWDLLKDSVWMIVVLCVLVLCFILWSIPLAKKLVTEAYKPWGNVVKAMQYVSNGEMSTRLPCMDCDLDMEVVSKGFNGMMEQLNILMEKVKEEQHQLDQIRMEALQSQIQPHFLYNTLDCIHWQAVVNGNKEISSLVKALASYYRICLSKGKDIITIGEELEYTRNYLYIMEERYGEVLTYEIEKDRALEEYVIPKMTLQPLIENAIYHGIKLKENICGKVHITVEGSVAEIILKVADDGAGMEEKKIQEMNEMIRCYDEEFGYGVRNVNRRIQLYFGEKYGLKYGKNEKGGITVEVHLPKSKGKKREL